MLNNARSIAVLALLLCCSAAGADPTSDKLTQIEAETMLLKARERQLDVQASILAKQDEIAAKHSAGKADTHSPAPGDPVLQGVEGLGHALFATLQLGDGSVIDVQAGELLANGMRVVSIAPGSVLVQKGKKRIRLALQAPRQAGPNLALPGAMLALPPSAPRGALR